MKQFPISRRNLIIGASVVALALPIAGNAFADTKYQIYTEEKFKELTAAGKPVMLDFYAEWCGTCRAQDRTVGVLQREFPKLLNVTILRVDWDQEAGGPLVKALKIPRRSTLVVFKGEEEVARLVAVTSKDAIREMMEKAL